MCRHIGLLLGKRLDTILLRHRIRKYLDSPSTRYRIRGNKSNVSVEVKVKALKSEAHLTETYLVFHFVHEVAESFIPHPGRDVSNIALRIITPYPHTGC